MNKMKNVISAGEQQDFFGQASRGEHAPLKPLEDPVNPQHQYLADIYQKHKGNFDEHIETSIPNFRTNSYSKMHSILQTYPQNANMLDIASSEGSLGKTITEASQGGIKTTNLDPQENMINAFNTKSQVPGAESVSAAFGASFKDENGKIVPKFAPKHSYDVVHESMAFQFFGPEREEHIAEAKRLLAPDGIFLSEEKVRTDNEAEHEAKKDAWKAQYHTPEALQRKQEQVGFQGEDTGGAGMMDKMVHQDVLESLLKKYFKYVAQYWSSGNFKGYVASDSKQKINSFLSNYSNEPHQFEAESVPRIVTAKESKWKIAENQDANRMYRQHTDGTPVAETTFESIQNKDTSEPYEDEYIIVNGKKWKKVRRKNNPEPDNYKDPIGGWGFYSKLIERMESQPWVILSVEKAKPIDVNNLAQYPIPRSYKIVDQLVPHFARYGVIPIARKFSDTIKGYPLDKLPEGGTFQPGATKSDEDYSQIYAYDHNIHFYDPETQQIVYGMNYSLNHPNAFEYYSTDEYGNPASDDTDWLEEEYYEHKYPTYVTSIHYNQPGNHEGAQDPRFHDGGRIYLSNLDEKGKPTTVLTDYQETVDNFNKRYPRLSLSVLRWMQQNLPKPIGADIINPKLKEKAQKQDFVTLSKWKKVSNFYSANPNMTYNDVVDSGHDYDPEWDYELEENQQKIQQIREIINQNLSNIQSYVKEKLKVPTFQIHFVKNLNGDVARYVDGTYSDPVILIDIDAHINNTESPQHLAYEIQTSIIHELAHAYEEMHELENDEDFAEGEGQSFHLGKWKKISIPPADLVKEFAQKYEQSQSPEEIHHKYPIRGHKWQLIPENFEKLYKHPDWPLKTKYTVNTLTRQDVGDPAGLRPIKHWEYTPMGEHHTPGEKKAGVNSGAIYINPFLSPEAANETLWHELQHAYQHQEKLWTPEMKEKYINPLDFDDSGMTDEEIKAKIEEYHSHPMELDANLFADFMRRYPLIEESEPYYSKLWVPKEHEKDPKPIVDEYYREKGSKRRLRLPSIKSKWIKKSTYLPGFYSTTLIPDEENGGYKMILANDERMTHWHIHPANGTYPDYRGIYNPEVGQILHLSSPEEYSSLLKGDEYGPQDIMSGPEAMKATPEEHEKVWQEAAAKGVYVVAPTNPDEFLGGLLYDDGSEGRNLNVVEKRNIKVPDVHVMHKRPNHPEEFKFRYNTPEENDEKYWNQISFSSPAPKPKQSKWKIAGETRKKRLERAATLPEDTSEIIHTFDDGWTLRLLKTIGDSHREGELMGNCFSGNAHGAGCLAKRILHNYQGKHGDLKGEFGWPYEGNHFPSFDEKVKYWNKQREGDLYVRDNLHIFHDEPLETIGKENTLISLRDPDNLPHVSIDGEAAFGRHNSGVSTQYKKKYFNPLFKKHHENEDFIADMYNIKEVFPFIRHSKWIKKEAPARSKAQYRYMQGICNGSIEPPEGMTRAQACEYVEGQSSKGLPEKKSHWVEGYHAAVLDPRNKKIYVSDSPRGFHSNALEDNGYESWPEEAWRGLYNPETQDLVHMSSPHEEEHPAFWEILHTDKMLRHAPSDYRETWLGAAENQGLPVSSVRVMTHEGDNAYDLPNSPGDPGPESNYKFYTVYDEDRNPKEQNTFLSKIAKQEEMEESLIKMGFSEKAAVVIALDYISKLSYWIDGYHAAVALRDPETEVWHMDVGFNDKLTHGGVTADYINDLGTRAMREAVADKNSRTDYYNYHTARGLYNPTTKDFIHMSHPDFWDETDYNFKSLDQDERDRMEAFWRQLAQQNGVELDSIRVLNNQTGHIEDLSIADFEMPEEVTRAQRMYERNRPLTTWERERGGYDTKTGKVKTAHWIQGFQAAIINQKGELEVAPPDKEILDDEGNVIDVDDTPWYATHWDIGGYPQYRGLYNHDTGELIHMSSPEEHQSLSHLREYLESKDDAINPLEHETIWREAAKKSNVPVNDFKLLYEKEEDEYGDEAPYKRWAEPMNQKEDFHLVDPEEFMPKVSKWKKRGHWLEDYYAAVITPEGEMKVAKDWNYFHGNLLPDASTLARRGFHRGLYNKETGQLLHMTTPEEWKKLENSWGSYEEEDPDVRWPLGFEWIRDPKDFISPYKTEKEWLNAAENSQIPVSEVKFFSGEPEVNPFVGFDVNKFNTHSPQEIAAKYGKWKTSKKDAWEAVLDGELGHDIITTGTWEEVKKQTIKWLKQLKDGYINKKNPHDNKKIDPEAKEQDGHALEDLKLYEEKKRWSFHFDHGKHPYDLIIQPVGYKESKWKISMAERTGDPEIDSLIEEFLKGGGYWFDFEDKGTDFKYKDQAGKEYNWENVTPEIYQQNVDELPLETGEAQIRRWQDPEQAHGSCGDASMSFINFLNRKGFKAECVDIDGWYMDKGEKPFYPEITRPEATGHAVVKITKDGKTYIIDWTAAQFQYARENWREGPIEDFKQFPFIHKQDEAGNWQRSWDKQSKWKIADKKKKKIHPKFQTSLKEHQRSVRKYGPLKTHKVRNFKKKSVLNEQQAKELFAEDPYMYHDVSAARSKSGWVEHIPVIDSIFKNGILPKEQTGIAEYDDWLTSRPDHVYIGKGDFYSKSRRPALRIDMSKVDPSTLAPDEDLFPVYGYNNNYSHLIDFNNIKSPPFEQEQPQGSSLGDWMHGHPHLDTPKNVKASKNLIGSVAVNGGVPADAIHYNPEWLEDVMNDIDITIENVEAGIEDENLRIEEYLLSSIIANSEKVPPEMLNEFMTLYNRIHSIWGT